MRKCFYLLLPLALLLCCHRPLFENPTREGADPDRSRPAAPDSLRGRPVVYATALVFPDSVDWRKGDTRGARLVLFQDGVPIDTISRNLDPSPEKIRFQDGHVWTDFTDGSQTVIACDGQPLFSYPGEERLLGFLVHDGSVHTLGQHPGGGFSYRVNGVEAFSSPNGTLVGGGVTPDWEAGAFCRDSSGIYYCYALPVSTEEAHMWEYRVMKGKEVRKMIPALSGSRLYDIRVHRGCVYRLEYRYGRMCLMQEDELIPLTLPENAHEVTLVRVDDRMCIKGFHEEGSASCIWIRDADTLLRQHVNPHGQHPANLFIDKGESVLVNQDFEDCVVQVRRDSTTVYFPTETYRLQTPGCVRYRKGLVAVALTGDLYVEENMLLVNTQKTVLPFHGYFTGIYFE